MIENFLFQSPYRILGVSSNAGIKLIHKNLSKIKAFSKLNKDVEFEYDFSFLNYRSINRSIDTIKKAENRILLDENKLKCSLFWFQDITSYDAIALANLIKGNPNKAIDIWGKVIKSGELNSKNFSAFNNLSTLMLFLQIDSSNPDRFKKDLQSISELKTALDYKVQLINSDYFKDFKNSIGIVSDINTVEIQTSMAESLLESLHLNFSNPEILNIIKDLDESFSGIISNNLVKEPVSNIKEQIKNASEQIKENEKNGVSVGKALIIKTVSDIGYLKKTLGTEHYQYQTIVDKLCNQIIQCGIVCFNSTEDDEEYLSSYKYAFSLALNEKTKTRANDCVKHCKEEKGANICSCCSVSKINKNTPYLLTVYKETNRTYFPARVEYSRGTLNLFFCTSCLEKCSEKDNTAQIIAWVIAFVGGVIGGVASEHIVGFIIGGVVGLTLGNFIGGFFSGDNSSMIRNHPNTQKHLKQGYKLIQPSA